LNYSTHQLPGFGLTDGECTERFWSYLRPLAAITKDMTSSHRTDLSDAALCHFAAGKTAGLGKKNFS
jgi:Kyakuja-Dileera-Zisupton transposase